MNINEIINRLSDLVDGDYRRVESAIKTVATRTGRTAKLEEVVAELTNTGNEIMTHASSVWLNGAKEAIKKTFDRLAYGGMPNNQSYDEAIDTMALEYLAALEPFVKERSDEGYEKALETAYIHLARGLNDFKVGTAPYNIMKSCVQTIDNLSTRDLEAVYETHLAAEKAMKSNDSPSDNVESSSIVAELEMLRAENKRLRQMITVPQDKPPMQPIEITPDGVARFRANQIVKWAVDTRRISMNELAMMDFTDEDRMQFAQLIGYSVSGYGDLSYVSNDSREQTTNIVDTLSSD